MDATQFQVLIRKYYRKGRSHLPWRKTTDPYHIAISEIMLQQTQVSRVIEKYNSFLTVFPTVGALARAPLGKVLTLWSGLGYNRRAKFLHSMAKQILAARGGVFPTDPAELEQLPGIGPYTARAIAAFAYNAPVAFVETNIRTVYVHHFFPGADRVSDRELLPLIEQTLDRKNPRKWYAALMDYGSELKQAGNRAHRQSVHYVRQTPFVGSRRQVRGAVIRSLVAEAKSLSRLQKELSYSEELLSAVVSDLTQERLIERKGAKFTLATS